VKLQLDALSRAAFIATLAAAPAACATALAVLAAAAAPIAAAAAAADPPLVRRVDEFVRREMQREHVPGVAVGIVRRGEVVLSAGYGESNVELHTRVSAQTLFQSGSLGKQLTATALMLEVQAGRIGLDDPLTRFFTDAPASWRGITVRNLLTHTSGIPDYTEGALDAGGGSGAIDYRRDYTEAQLLKIAYSLPLDFEPGTRWSYSNTGYLLLGILIHRVTGRFYGDVLADQVFRPLGMHTARIISEADIIEGRAAGYRLVEGELKNQEWVAPSLNTTADGALYLSVSDWIAWDRGLRDHAILAPQSWAQIYTRVRLRSGNTYPYGFGWEVDESKGQPWYHHSGSWQGFRTTISRYLADDLTIIVLCNLAEAEPARFVDGIAALVDPELERIRPSSPLADREPAVSARARKLLIDASKGTLEAEDFLPPFSRGVAAHAQDQHRLLAPLGAARQLTLVERRDLGDDRYYVYEVSYPNKTLRLELELAPDDRIAAFDLAPD